MRRYSMVFAAFAISFTSCGGTATDLTTTGSTARASTSTSISTTTAQPPATTSTVGDVEQSTTTVANARQITSGAFAVPFLIDQPEGTRLRKEATTDVMYLQVASGDNAYFIITTRGPDTVQEWKETLADQPISISDDPVTTEIGGIVASYLEFTVQDPHAAPGELGFTFEQGDAGRVYSLEVNGEPVTILAVSGLDLWASFEAVVDQLVTGLTWE